MDNLMNTKLISGSAPRIEGHSNPPVSRNVAPGFGSAFHLAHSGTHGSLVALDSYGNIGHHRASSVIRLPHPDYTSLDMPIFPSINAILQGIAGKFHFLKHFRIIQKVFQYFFSFYV